MNNKDIRVVIGEATRKKYPAACEFLDDITYNRNNLVVACVDAVIRAYPPIVKSGGGMVSEHIDYVLEFISNADIASDVVKRRGEYEQESVKETSLKEDKVKNGKRKVIQNRVTAEDMQNTASSSAGIAENPVKTVTGEEKPQTEKKKVIKRVIVKKREEDPPSHEPSDEMSFDDFLFGAKVD